MVTEKPPRRPKTQKKPVTIDLTAEQDAAIAEPVRSNDTDETRTTSGEAPWAESAADDAKHASDQTDDQKPSMDKTATNEESAEPVSEPSVGPAVETAPEEQISKPVDDHPEANGAQTVTQPTEQEHRQPATSTLLAAGIFGGIVALALAGSMQYAGFLPGSSSSSSASEEIAALRQQIEALSQTPAADTEVSARLEALENAQSEDGNSEMAERLSALERELAATRSTADSALSESSTQLADLRTRVDAAEARLNEPGEQETAARAIAAAALKAAIDRGGSFQAELSTFAAVSPDDPALGQLQPLAEGGVSSRAQLLEQFSPASDAMLQAAEQSDPDQGIAGRLMSSALSVVKVRRTGDVEGDTPAAIVARMENALKAGELQSASTEWEKLPEASKAASQKFKQSLDARIAVDALIGDSLARAVSATASQN